MKDQASEDRRSEREPSRETFRSPFAPAVFPSLPALRGVQMAVAATEMVYKGRHDLWLAVLSDPAGEPCPVAAVVTRSALPSAPIAWIRNNMRTRAPQSAAESPVSPVADVAAAVGGGPCAKAFICNAGNANAFTGRQGLETVRTYCTELAKHLKVPETTIFPASTGVIGASMEASRITQHLGGMLAAASSPTAAGAAEEASQTTGRTPGQTTGPIDWETAAQAIMTTDTYPKGACRRIEGSSACLVGLAKGSGMVAPDMATVLAFLFTDASVPAAELQADLAQACQKSFNRISVDGECSTSDSVLLAATGHAGPVSRAAFQQALEALCQDLALQVAKDGEGLTKFVTVTTSGARNDHDAETIARAVLEAPLVKTMLYGGDANWGRIVMAVGKTGLDSIHPERLRLWLGAHLVACNGAVAETYDEERVSRYLQEEQEIHIRIDLGVGTAETTLWGCDLTHGYIEINGAYRSQRS